MAVRLEGTIKRWIGLSTATKPFPGQVRESDGVALGATDVPSGSSFFEADTWRIWRWSGTEWQYTDQNAEIVAYLKTISEQLGKSVEYQKIQVEAL